MTKGTWSFSGSTSKIPESASVAAISTELKNSGDDESNLPNLRIPGALTIDPMIRKLAKSKEMTVSENAIWLLIYSVREYTCNILQHTITKCQSDKNDPSSSSISNDHRPLVASSNPNSCKITPLDLARSLECTKNNTPPIKINQTLASSRLGWERCIQSLDRFTPQSDLMSLQTIRQNVVKDIETASMQRCKREQDEKKAIEERRLAEERTIVEEKRAIEEKRLAEKSKRLAEERKRMAEERKRLAEERKKAEEKRFIEQMKLAEQRKRAKERKVAEEKRLADAKRHAKEAALKATSMRFPTIPNLTPNQQNMNLRASFNIPSRIETKMEVVDTQVKSMENQRLHSEPNGALDASPKSSSPAPVPRGRGRGVKDLSALRASASSTPTPTRSSSVAASTPSENPKVPVSSSPPASSISSSDSQTGGRGRGTGTKDLAALKARSMRPTSRDDNISQQDSHSVKRTSITTPMLPSERSKQIIDISNEDNEGKRRNLSSIRVDGQDHNIKINNNEQGGDEKRSASDLLSHSLTL